MIGKWTFPVGIAIAAFMVAGLASADPGGVHRDRTCVRQCRQSYRTCLQTPRTDARTCRMGCADLITAAQTACQSDPTSDACQTAWTQAKACLDPCHTVLRSGATQCRSDVKTCANACPTVQPSSTHPDPFCRQQCQLARRSCVGLASGQELTCLQGCSDLVQAARDACMADISSTDCQTARDSANACLQPCRDAVHTAVDQCRSDSDTCIQACPAATNPSGHGLGLGLGQGHGLGLGHGPSGHGS